MKNFKVLIAAGLPLFVCSNIYASDAANRTVPDNLIAAFEQVQTELNTNSQIQTFLTDLKAKIDGGADVNAKNAFGLSPIVYAVTLASWTSSAEIASQRNQLVSFLIANGASVNQVSGDGWFPLHYVMVGVVGLGVENPRLIEILCNAGADPLGKSQKRLKEFPLGVTPKEMLMLQTQKPSRKVMDAFSSCK